MSMSRPFSFALAMAPLLVSCAAVPDLGPKPLTRAPDSVASARSLTTEGAGQWPGGRWWTDYQDPQLTALIEEALQGSPDMAAASARFRRATALAQQAGAALAPQLDAQGQATFDKQSYNNGFPRDFVPKGWLDRGSLTLNGQFDIDLWGRNRAALAAATSEARAAQIDAQQAQLMLTTAIASAYADLARLFVARDLQQNALDIRAATGKLVDDRVRSGLDTRGDLRQAQSGLSAARADLSAADEAIGLRRNQIAALMGEGPDRGLSLARPALGRLAARGLPAGVTTDLVGRRPDVAAALARTQAAASRIKVARADFFPAISLGALVGVQSLGLENLLKTGSTYGSVGPAVSLPIFHGGALRGQYRGVRAIYDEAVADYDRIVVDAYREVADAVTSQTMLGARRVDTRAALAASEEAYAIARKRYEGGLSTYLDVLIVEERLLAVRRAAADLDMRAFTLDIALIRALGGGFAVADAPLPKDDLNG